MSREELADALAAGASRRADRLHKRMLRHPARGPRPLPGQARALGSLLVVGLNSDDSVSGLKGSQRPLIPEAERAEMLAHLESVDYVCMFDEARPDNLIEVVKPHIHAKGGDNRVEDLPEAEVVRRHGGEVVILPLVEGRSTTNVITRVLEAYSVQSS